MKQSTLAEKLKDLRAQKGLSQQQLADICQIDIRSIQRLENVVSKPRNTTLKRLSDYIQFLSNLRNLFISILIHPH